MLTKAFREAIKIRIEINENETNNDVKQSESLNHNYECRYICRQQLTHKNHDHNIAKNHDRH